jgi:hypothetical protein
MTFAGAANAATVSQIVNSGGSPARVFVSDESGEKIIDRNNNGILDVGDSVRGVLTFDQISVNSGPLQHLLQSVGNEELTGIFQILVTSKVATGDPTAPWRFTFAVDNSFVAERNASAGTMFQLYVDGGLSHFNVNAAGSTAASEATVTDGQLFLELGIAQAGNQFFSFGGDNPALAGNPSTRLADSIFALSRTSFNGVAGGWNFQQMSNPAGNGEFIGTSQIGGGFPGSPWSLSNETDAEFTVVTGIPTPSALGGGVALMLGLLRRKARA